MSAVDVRVVNPDGQGAVLPSVYSYVSSQPPPSGGNAYYDALKALPSFWKGYPFRSEADIAPYRQSSRPGVSYDPGMDALKAVIPAIREDGWGIALAHPVTASDTVWTVDVWASSTLLINRLVKVDAEYALITAVNATAKQITVARAQQGSTAVSHAAGAPLGFSVNSLQNQVRVPIGTTDGHQYLFTWDAYWTRSWIKSGVGMKAFQMSHGDDGIWLETQLNISSRYSPNVNYDTQPGGLTLRSYNKLGGVADWSLTDGNSVGPSVTKVDIVQPMDASFPVNAERWVRYWCLVDQRANDYEYVDYWVADSQTDPVQVFHQLPVSIPPSTKNPNSIVKWWIELNTSQDRFVRGDLRDLVTYVRNLVVLRDPGDISSLLVRP